MATKCTFVWTQDGDNPNELLEGRGTIVIGCDVSLFNDRDFVEGLEKRMQENNTGWLSCSIVEFEVCGDDDHLASPLNS